MSDQDRSLTYALSLASYLGVAVFPCYQINPDGLCACPHADDGKGGCACGLPRHDKEPGVRPATCSSPGKHPVTAHGLKDASNEEARIRALWSRAPRESNIGIRTGDGLYVVDCDVKPGADGVANLAKLEAEHGALPVTLSVRTGSGGLHLYFRHKGDMIRNSVSKIAQSVDIRGDGGYVVCPPSNHYSGGTYTWIDELAPIADAPEWLIDLARKRPPTKMVASVVDINRAPTSRAAEGDSRRYALGALRGVCDDLRATPNGTRHTEAFNKAFKMGGFVGSAALAASEVEVELFNATRAAGWDTAREMNTLTAIRDGIKAGQTKPLEAPARSMNGSRQQPSAAAYAEAHAGGADDERAAIQGEASVIELSPRRPDGAPLPNDVRREEALIATLIFRDGSFDECSSVLSAEHFYSAANSAIYGAITELSEAGNTYTARDILNLWSETNRVKYASDIERLSDDRLLIPFTSVRHEASVLRDLYRQREMIKVCEQAALDGRKRTPDVQGYLDDVLVSVEQISEAPGFDDIETAHSCAAGFLERMEVDLARGEAPKGLNTTFAQLDQATGGLIKKKQILLAGRTSQGKTALACAMAMNVADVDDADGVKRNGVLIFSLETPVDDLTDRMTYTLAGMSIHERDTGYVWTRCGDDALRGMSADEQAYYRSDPVALKALGRESGAARLSNASAAYAAMPIVIYYKPKLTVAEMRRIVRRARAAFKRQGKDLALVVIDYLQLMDGTAHAPRNANSEQLISAVSLKTREMAQDEDIPLLALAQINRGIDKQKDQRPVMADLRGSGSLEMNADTIIFVHRESKALGDACPTEYKGIAELIIAKNKNGPTKTVYTGYVEQTMGFVDTPKSKGFVA